MEYNFIDEIRLCGTKATAKRIQDNLNSRGIYFRIDSIELTLLSIWQRHLNPKEE